MEKKKMYLYIIILPTGLDFTGRTRVARTAAFAVSAKNRRTEDRRRFDRRREKNVKKKKKSNDNNNADRVAARTRPEPDAEPAGPIAADDAAPYRWLTVRRGRASIRQFFSPATGPRGPAVNLLY